MMKEKRNKIYKIIFFTTTALLITLATLDIISDWNESDNIFHLIIEVFLTIIGIYALFITYNQFKGKLFFIDQLKKEKRKVISELNILKTKTNFLRQNLRTVFEEQFEEWNFTQAETKVAFLIIRGFNFKQIAHLLIKSERTVRTQAIKVYEKSGFRNRSDFTGFFIESVFDLGDEESFF